MPAFPARIIWEFAGGSNVAVICAVAGVILVAARLRPRLNRPLQLAPAPRQATLLQRLGAVVRSLLRRPPDPAADLRAGRAIAAGLGGLVIDVVLGVVAVTTVVSLPIVRAHRNRRRRTAQIISELPEVIDLLRLAVLAGCTPLSALTTITEHPRGPVSSELRTAVERVGGSVRLVDALTASGRQLGEPARGLLAALVANHEYGSPLAQPLERLGNEARAERRRRAETSARKVPVRMLLPLVVCVLPAFVLLTLVPTLTGTFDSLNLG